MDDEEYRQVDQVIDRRVRPNFFWFGPTRIRKGRWVEGCVFGLAWTKIGPAQSSQVVVADLDKNDQTGGSQ